MEVYNLILDRGYLGALKYASEIEDKNFRLASEIDQIVSELYRIASGGSGFRYAQSAMPKFNTYTPRSMPSAPVQTNEPESISTPSFSPDSRPAGMSAPGGIGSAAGSIGGLVLKIKGLIESMDSGKIPKSYGRRLINQLLGNTLLDKSQVRKLSRLVDTKQWTKATQYVQQIHDQLNPATATTSPWIGDKARKLKTNLKLEKSRLILKILEGLATKFPSLMGVLQFISKNAKFLGALAIPFDTYDIYTDYEREGLSSRVICKIISIILGISSLIATASVAGASLAPGLAALWAISSFGCGFIPQSDKKEDAYKNLTQSEIDKAESTVTLESLPQSDQNLVRGLFNIKSKADLINNLRGLRDSKKFEKPVESLAYIQRQLASGNGQIVPIG